MNAGSLAERVWRSLLLGLMTLFVVNVGLLIAAVATSSFAKRWLGTWLPEGWTASWYSAAWKEFQLGSVLWVTIEVVLAVVVLSLLIGVPAAYTLARRDFPGKRALMLLFLLPLMVPPMTYGIPLATVLYQAHLGGTIWGVILANLIPAAPFVILVMTPFVEQIDVNLGGVWACTKAALPHLRKAAGSEHGAWVINIGSLAGRNTFPGGSTAVVYQWLGPYVQFSLSKGFFARFTAGADIEEGGDEMDDLATRVAYRVDDHPYREGLTVFSPDPLFALPGSAGAGGSPDLFEKSCRNDGRNAGSPAVARLPRSIRTTWSAGTRG